MSEGSSPRVRREGEKECVRSARGDAGHERGKWREGKATPRHTQLRSSKDIALRCLTASQIVTLSQSHFMAHNPTNATSIGRVLQ